MAVDMFLKLDGIKGESQDSKHKGEIEVLSFSWGVAQQGTAGHGGGAGAGKVNVQDVSIAKLVDSASPSLMEAACQGQHIGSGLLTLRKAGKEQLEYMKIKFTDVLITSWQTGGAGAGETFEQVSFSFESVELTGTEQRPDGSSGASNTVSCNFGGKH
jgi:type VI secretion system secreted protein Hcp